MVSIKRLLRAAVLLGIVAPAAAAPFESAPAALPTLDAGTSLLVVSPHPDDETLCCAGVIRRVLAAGGHVSVVWITSGDGSRLSMLFTERSLFRPVEKVRELAAKRMLEARTATGILGVSRTQQYFLGYPDGRISELLTTHPDRLEKDFQAVLEHVQPNLVLAPSLEDTHPDHSGSGRLTYDVLERRGELAKARYWIVHGGEGWPSPRGLMPYIPLNRPPTRGFQAHEFTLTDAEVDLKQQAIEAYRTQMRFMAPFLLAFVRTTELYATTP